jgi:hypothetical protein
MNFAKENDFSFMHLALRLARRDCGATSPNPNGIPSISPRMCGTRYPGSIVQNIFLPQRGSIAVSRATLCKENEAGFCLNLSPGTFVVTTLKMSASISCASPFGDLTKSDARRGL